MAYTLNHGDVIDLLPLMPADSYDGGVIDPPYGLSEAPGPEELAAILAAWLKGEAYRPNKRGFMGKVWDGFVPGPEVWREVLRVLKPGAHVFVFASPRTQDLMGLALRLAGFEIRDTVAWLYSSGLPKSMDLCKVVGKVAPPRADAWQGYGTTLKPAMEPCFLAMKPMGRTFVSNALEHGVAGLNIGGARIPYRDDADLAEAIAKNPGRADLTQSEVYGASRPQQSVNVAGRWPANAVLDEHAALALDKQSGILKTGGGVRNSAGHGRSVYGRFSGNEPERVFPANSGGASRFYYVAKASAGERSAGLADKNPHPCVKPLALVRHLATIILPPKRDDGPRRMLVPFCGSGSEMIGALQAGWEEVTGIEREAEYVAIAGARLAHHVPERASKESPMALGPLFAN